MFLSPCSMPQCSDINVIIENGLQTALSAEVKIRADQISQTVQKGQIGSAINQSAEKITIKANKFGWESNNSSLTTEGILRARLAVLSDATVSGTITTGQGSWETKLSNGWLRMLYKGREHGGIYGDALDMMSYGWFNGVHIYGNDTVEIDARNVYFRTSRIYTYTGSDAPIEAVYEGYTGTINGAEFVNGICVGRE